MYRLPEGRSKRNNSGSSRFRGSWVGIFVLNKGKWCFSKTVVKDGLMVQLEVKAKSLDWHWNERMSVWEAGYPSIAPGGRYDPVVQQLTLDEERYASIGCCSEIRRDK
jgi:hypothetical protein